jgi:hypothetical protein
MALLLCYEIKNLNENFINNTCARHHKKTFICLSMVPGLLYLDLAKWCLFNFRKIRWNKAVKIIKINIDKGLAGDILNT